MQSWAKSVRNHSVSPIDFPSVCFPGKTGDLLQMTEPTVLSGPWGHDGRGALCTYTQNNAHYMSGQFGEICI